MSDTRVLFVIPPYYNCGEIGDNSVTTQLPSFTIPYGVLSLAAYASTHCRNGVSFAILDLNLETNALAVAGEDVPEGSSSLFRKQLESVRPDILAISALFNSCYDHVGSIVSIARLVVPDLLVVIGGGLATNLYGELLAAVPGLDGACYGEGEIPFAELIDSGSRREYLESSSAWVTASSVENRAPCLHLVEDLDEIPPLDYRLVPLERYSGRSLDKRYASMSMVEMSIHTSRGCPFDCVFCANGKTHGKNVRFMSVGTVLAQVERMVSEYGMEVLLIEDDHFMSDKARAKSILRGIRRFGVKVEFPNGIAVYGIDEEIACLLAEAGVTTLSLAIESGSDYVLTQVIKKPLVVKMIKPAVEILSRNGIDVHAFIVMGLPGETDAHRAETLRMLRDVGFDWVKIYIAIPIAGSRLFDICKENGYLTTSSFSHHVTTKCVIRTPDIEPERLEHDVYLMNLDVNFVNNHNIRSGNFEKALIYLESIAKKYPTHAFAHHALAVAYRGTGQDGERAAFHEQCFLDLVAADDRWRSYALRLGLKV